MLSLYHMKCLSTRLSSKMLTTSAINGPTQTRGVQTIDNSKFGKNIGFWLIACGHNLITQTPTTRIWWHTSCKHRTYCKSRSRTQPDSHSLTTNPFKITVSQKPIERIGQKQDNNDWENKMRNSFSIICYLFFPIFLILKYFFTNNFFAN